MITNNLGTYLTLDEVWGTYPTGGIEGAYVYIGENIYVWDKYVSNWRIATEEDLQEGEVTASKETTENIAGYINYGDFATIDEVLATYPQGGVEGCYVKIGETIFLWNKYTSNWEEASADDFISTSNYTENLETGYKLIVCVGKFDSVKDVWDKYPAGGIEGTYVLIGEDKYLWDKYTNSWKIATEIESSLVKPIVVTTQDGVVEYTDNYINYLGIFDTIEEAWEMFPEGGKEGDYIIVAGEQLKWNKYTSSWGEVEGDNSSQLRAVATIYGDLRVLNNLIVGEELIAVIIEKLATRIALSKLRPIRVESEEIMEQMITSGQYDPEQIYYVPETE